MILTNQPIQLKTVAFRCLPWLNTSKQNSTDRSEVHGNFSKQTTSSDCNDLETPVHVNDPNVLHFMSYSSAITDHELRQYLDNWVISQPAEAEIRSEINQKITIRDSRLVVEGTLEIVNTNLTSLPERLYIIGTLRCKNTPKLTTIPEDLIVNHSIFLENCTNLTTLPHNFQVVGSLQLKGCHNLKITPPNLYIGNHLIIENCDKLEAVAPGLYVEGNITIINCNKFTTLPNDLSIKKSLLIDNCKHLKTTPSNLKVEENLTINHCNNLKTLSTPLIIKGSLNLNHCVQILSIGVRDQALISIDRAIKIISCWQLQSIYLSKCTPSLELAQCYNLTELAWCNGFHFNSNYGSEINITIIDCNNLEKLPDKTPYRSFWKVSSLNLTIEGCQNLTILPNWPFEFKGKLIAKNTGIPNRLINAYMSNPEFNNDLNKRFENSLFDEDNGLIPIIKRIKNSDSLNILWQPLNHNLNYKDISIFFERLLNLDIPPETKRRLIDTLKQTVEYMEDEFRRMEFNIAKCSYINNRVLQVASTSVGSCDDKTKIGYVYLQIFSPMNGTPFFHWKDYEQLGIIINFVDGIQSGRIVLRSQTDTMKEFINVARFILDGNFDENLKLKAKLSQKLNGESDEEFDENQFNATLWIDSLSRYMNNSELTQHLTSFIDGNIVHLRDPVEDILYLTYEILPSQHFHKIPMTFKSLSTLKNNHENAAKHYILNEIKRKKTNT